MSTPPRWFKLFIIFATLGTLLKTLAPSLRLTVVDALPDGFTVAVIPHTTAVTTLGSRPPGSHVNLEVDVTAKYIEKLVAAHVADIAGGKP